MKERLVSKKQPKPTQTPAQQKPAQQPKQPMGRGKKPC